MNKQSADKIIMEYLPKIYGYGVKKAFMYDEAEEISAEIVKEVYTSLLRVEEPKNIEGYIWRICENTYSKYVSSKKKHEGISIDGLPIPYYEDFLLAETEEEIKKLRVEIAFLTKKRREVVYKYYYENKSIAVIAKETNMPEGTVKWHLNKARNELKEGFSMERRIGKLGLSPVSAKGFGHFGNLSTGSSPDIYLGDKINLNIVYSVYRTPRTAGEIAEELGLTLVFVEDKINYLENNGFLEKTKGDKYTTFVRFDAEEYSVKLSEKKLMLQKDLAEILVEKYVPLVRKAIKDTEVYVPGGNYHLFEAAAVFFAIVNRCRIKINTDLSRYHIKTLSGGDYIAFVQLESKNADPEYKTTINEADYMASGSMYRISEKYPEVSSWSVDTRYSSRNGNGANNRVSDFEFIYEIAKGYIQEDMVNKYKFDRLKRMGYLTSEGKINIIMIKSRLEDFFDKLPEFDENIKKHFANNALDIATQEAKFYPPHMQDLIISLGVNDFIGSVVSLMVMDILYGNGTFKPLTENERVSANLLMFTDKLPEIAWEK